MVKILRQKIARRINCLWCNIIVFFDAPIFGFSRDDLEFIKLINGFQSSDISFVRMNFAGSEADLFEGMTTDVYDLLDLSPECVLEKPCLPEKRYIVYSLPFEVNNAIFGLGFDVPAYKRKLNYNSIDIKHWNMFDYNDGVTYFCKTGYEWYYYIKALLTGDQRPRSQYLTDLSAMENSENRWRVFEIPSYLRKCDDMRLEDYSLQ